MLEVQKFCLSNKNFFYISKIKFFHIYFFRKNEFLKKAYLFYNEFLKNKNGM